MKMQINISLDKFVLLKQGIKKAGFKIPEVLSDNFKNKLTFPNITGRKKFEQNEIYCNISFNAKPEHIHLLNNLLIIIII